MTVGEAEAEERMKGEWQNHQVDAERKERREEEEGWDVHG